MAKKNDLSSASPTVEEHLQNLADGIDGMVEKVKMQMANELGASPIGKAAQAVRAAQESRFHRAIDELRAEKEHILAAIETLPAELRALEARVVVGIKHLF